MKNEQIINQAWMLLLDRNLIWSTDFETIRTALGTHLLANQQNPDPTLLRLAEALLETTLKQ
jgi:hypothetical protein